MIVEKEAKKINGFIGILLMILLLLGCIFLFSLGSMIGIVLGIILIVAFLVVCSCMVLVSPNQAAVLTFFGSYIGCIRENGIWMVKPFATSKKISLRVRNFNSEKLKVNDTNGNPIEIAAVVVFKVTDPARALFDVDNYESFVEIQSETALRHVAAKYPYDSFQEGGQSLRGNSDEVGAELLVELTQRLAVAGVEVMEARLTHLAYATEIASAMLQRQQAEAILAARQIIVEGAVGMAQIDVYKRQEYTNLFEQEVAKLRSRLYD